MHWIDFWNFQAMGKSMVIKDIFFVRSSTAFSGFRSVYRGPSSVKFHMQAWDWWVLLPSSKFQVTSGDSLVGRTLQYCFSSKECISEDICVVQLFAFALFGPISKAPARLTPHFLIRNHCGALWFACIYLEKLVGDDNDFEGVTHFDKFCKG